MKTKEEVVAQAREIRDAAKKQIAGIRRRAEDQIEVVKQITINQFDCMKLPLELMVRTEKYVQEESPEYRYTCDVCFEKIDACGAFAAYGVVDGFESNTVNCINIGLKGTKLGEFDVCPSCANKYDGHITAIRDIALHNLMCDRMMSPEEAIERATDHFYGRDRVDGGKSALNVRVGGGEA